MENSGKPQDHNTELEIAIIRLNFSDPSYWEKFHPFSYEIYDWYPPKNIFKSTNKRRDASYGVSQMITVVNYEDEFDDMISHLKDMSEWAVDLEHSEHSYLGITCLIQISTKERNFVIDPFDLNRKIKQDLKPLMESGDYIKVFHGGFNDLRWLQRDFHIYAWPVVDTQVIYRKIAGIKNHEDRDENISLVNLIDGYLPSVELEKDYTRADFKKRPLPSEIVKYAIEDTMYLLPALGEMRKDLENTRNNNIAFETIIKDCVEYMSKKILYRKKEQSSLEEEIQTYKHYYKIKNRNDMTVFYYLHLWRGDKAKVLDVVEDLRIISTAYLMELVKLDRPASLEAIKNCLSSSLSRNKLHEMDLLKIKEIIDTSFYKRLTLEEALRQCPTCSQYSHPVAFWPGRRRNCNFKVTCYWRDWKEPQPVEDTEVEKNTQKKFDPFNLSQDEEKRMHRLVYDSNKFPYSKTRKLSGYSFVKEEICTFTDAIKTLIISGVKSRVRCPMCRKPVRQAVVCQCGGDLHVVYCKNCYITCGTGIPYCGELCLSGPVEFQPIDTILEECEIFLKRIKGENVMKKFDAMVNFFRNTEMEIMCNYCFGPLEDTMVIFIPKTAKSSWLKSVACCRGCDDLYMKSYKCLQEPIHLITFDKISHSLNSLMEDILEHCQQKKRPIVNTATIFGTQSIHKKRALKHLAEKESLCHTTVQSSNFEDSKRENLFYRNLLLSIIAIVVVCYALTVNSVNRT